MPFFQLFMNKSIDYYSERSKIFVVQFILYSN